MLDDECYMGVESTGSVNTGLGFGAEKGCPFIYELLNDYESQIFTPMDPVSCPVLTTRILAEYGYQAVENIQVIHGVKIYPVCYFAPINLTSRKLSLRKETYSIHWYDASWQTEEHKKIRNYELIAAEYLEIQWA